MHIVSEKHRSKQSWACTLIHALGVLVLVCAHLCACLCMSLWLLHYTGSYPLRLGLRGVELSLDSVQLAKYKYLEAAASGVRNFRLLPGSRNTAAQPADAIDKRTASPVSEPVATVRPSNSVNDDKDSVSWPWQAAAVSQEASIADGRPAGHNTSAATQSSGALSVRTSSAVSQITRHSRGMLSSPRFVAEAAGHVGYKEPSSQHQPNPSVQPVKPAQTTPPEASPDAIRPQPNSQETVVSTAPLPIRSSPSVADSHNSHSHSTSAVQQRPLLPPVFGPLSFCSPHKTSSQGRGTPGERSMHLGAAVFWASAAFHIVCAVASSVAAVAATAVSASSSPAVVVAVPLLVVAVLAFAYTCSKRQHGSAVPPPQLSEAIIADQDDDEENAAGNASQKVQLEHEKQAASQDNDIDYSYYVNKIERFEQLEKMLKGQEHSTEDVQAVRRQITSMRQSMKRAKAPGMPLGVDLDAPSTSALAEIEE